MFAKSCSLLVLSASYHWLLCMSLPIKQSHDCFRRDRVAQNLVQKPSQSLLQKTSLQTLCTSKQLSVPAGQLVQLVKPLPKYDPALHHEIVQTT
jgi:hypothetical protein